MATDYSEQIVRLEHKTELLLTRYESLVRINRELQERVQELQQALAAVEAERQKMRTQIEYLQVSSAIAADDDAAVRARDILSDLVREIDACIAEIVKDV